MVHDRSVRSLLHPVALACGAALLLASVGCGDDDGDDASTASTSAAVDDTVDETADETADEATDDVVAVATALCETYGGLQEPGAVDDLLALMSDDVVVTDTVLDADLEGKEAVRGYLTGEAFADFDTMDCGATVDRGGWVAGTYTLSSSETGQAGEGIAAIHVTDGLVDRQVNHYTPSSDPTAPPTGTVSESTIEDYCHAWDAGVDVEQVVSFLAPEAELSIVQPIVGIDAIRTFIEDDFDFDENDCGDDAVEFGQWSALASGFTNSDSGLTAGGVNVVHVDDEGLVDAHHVYYDPGA
jgi:hypothetical protein